MKLFISYAHDDMPLCKALVRLLDAHEVWYDHNLNGGEDWWKRILIQLDWCEGLIYLLSPTSVQSEYCLREAEIALNNQKILIPIVIHRRAQIPDFLRHLQYIDLSAGLDNVLGVVKLMNSLFEAERAIRRKGQTEKPLLVFDVEGTPPAVDNSKSSSYPDSLPYNYTFKLDQKGLSQRTKYTYIRWVCDYLERMTGQPHIDSESRADYLSNLPVGLLQESLSIAQVNAWLGMLKQEGVSKLSVVKAAIVAFAQTLSEDGLVEGELVHKIRAIQASKLDTEKRPRRTMSHSEITKLLSAIDSKSKFGQRNAALVSLLMVLRSGEVSALKWTDISVLGEKVGLRSPRSGQAIHLPQSTQRYLVMWYETLRKEEAETFDDESYVIRRFLHGDNITSFGVTTTSIQSILTDISQATLARKISPEDLRSAVRRSIQQKGREQL